MKCFRIYAIDEFAEVFANSELEALSIYARYSVHNPQALEDIVHLNGTISFIYPNEVLYFTEVKPFIYTVSFIN